MSGGFHIRVIGPGEAARIHALTQAAYAEYRHAPAPSSALDESAEAVRSAMDRGEYGAAIIEDPQGRAVGSVRFRVDPEDGLYFFRLGVVPEARGQGVARALLCWLEARARDAACGRIWCQVRLGVARNVRLYRTSGFRLCQQHVVLRHHESVVTGTMEKHLSAGTTQPPPPLQSRRATVSLPPTKEIAR